MSNNSEDHVWITSQEQRVRGGWVPPCLASPRCARPYAVAEIKTKKKQWNMKGGV